MGKFFFKISITYSIFIPFLKPANVPALNLKTNYLFGSADNLLW